MYELTLTLRTHTIFTHVYMTKSTSTTLSSEDRILKQISGTIHSFADDGHVTFPLWLHT